MKANIKLATKQTNGAYKLENNIPLPSRLKPNPLANLFSGMKVGQSFLIDSGEFDKARVSYLAGKYRQENKGVKFAFRQTNDGDRCWRTE
jgi:hypothetical protein